MTGVLVHVGLTTRDMDRSRRFYTEALGFTFDRELRMTGDQIDGLLRLQPKSDLHAVYLRLGVEAPAAVHVAGGEAHMDEHAGHPPGPSSRPLVR